MSAVEFKEIMEDPRVIRAVMELAENHFVYQLRGVGGITEFDIAEMFIIYENSLWYSQLKNWVDDKEFLKGDTGALGKRIHEGAETLLNVVRSGYTDRYGWWSLNALTQDKAQIKLMKLAIIAFAYYLKLVRSNTMMIVSRWLDVVIALVVGADWESQAKKIIRDKLYEKMPDEQALKPCINPYCDQTVDVRERHSGACCKEHINYICTHPTCVKKANKMGWKYYTHKWNTKIGKEHKDHRQT